jgi:hypothetical protein
MICLLFATVHGGVPHSFIQNPGFEGAKVTFYGAQFRDDKYHTDQALKRFPGPFEDAQISQGDFHRLYWGNPGQPSTPSIRYEWKSAYFKSWEGLTLNTEIESSIRLEDLDRNGDPLNWAQGNEDQQDVEVLQWWKWHNTTEGTTSRMELTKQTVYLVPADFIIQLWIPPSQELTGGHASGWEEGSWNNIQLWFKLYWHNWEIAFNTAPDVTEVPNIQADSFSSSLDYKGGYPIVAWIGGYDVNKGTQANQDLWSSLWFNDKNDRTLYDANAAAKVQLTPSLEGRYIDLWTALEDGEPAQAISSDIASTTQRIIHNYAEDLKNAPSKTIGSTQYFSLTVNEFGTYVWQDDFPFGGWHVLYPTAFYRVRMLYGVYGEFTYLWTQESAEDQGYTDETWEDREPTIVYTPNPWGQLLTNPATWFIVGLIVLIIIGIILAIVAPTFYIVLLSLFPIRLRQKPFIHAYSDSLSWKGPRFKLSWLCLLCFLCLLSGLLWSSPLAFLEKAWLHFILSFCQATVLSVVFSET